ncbi:DNA methyltransferase, partial [Klebsiella pneumoniae]|uniref:DNA methyltransferase n=1 Tax=Klebsiella pneumoniae TaxID=573 RepID=UPI003B5A93D6
IVSDVIEGTAQEKRVHPWAQGAEEVRALVRALTLPGDLVVGPMAGSGAFLWAAYLEGRRAIGWEVDPERYREGRAWLMEQHARHG